MSTAQRRDDSGAMEPGERKHGEASLRIALSEAVPAHMRDGLRELVALHVPEAHRRQGMASRLLRAVCEEADATCTTLLLNVASDGPFNLAAWYKRYGFTVIQAEPMLMARQVRRPVQNVANGVAQALATHRAIAESLH